MKKYVVDETVKQINIFDERWYEIQQKDAPPLYFPSVTTYLEAWPKGYGYELWLKNTKDPDAIRNEAGQLGSSVHNLIQRTLLGEKIRYLPNEMSVEEWERYLAWACFWKEFTAKHKVTLNKNFVEKVVYSEKLQCAGMLDLLCMVDGEPELLDWKTGKTVGDTAEMQVSVYAIMTGEHYPKFKPKKCIIVQINPALNKKGFRLYEIENIEENLEDFLHIQAVWRRANKNAKPKFKFYPMEVDLKYIQENNIILVRPEKEGT